MSVWLSIDWDAFIPEDPRWDFAHTEAIAPLWADALWEIRASSMLARGADLEQLTAFTPELHPDAFWAALAASGYELGGAKIAVADSHLWAAQWFLISNFEDRVKAPRIVHVDAHHDLGYNGMKSLNASVRKAHVDAGNWLGVYLRLFPKASATLVFPSWNDHAIDNALVQAPMTASVRKRVTFQQWPALPPGERVTRVFVCRSGAWSPPWHDNAFDKFIADLKDVACEDHVVQMEPTDNRAWNSERVAARAQVEKQMLEQFRAPDAQIVGDTL